MHNSNFQSFALVLEEILANPNVKIILPTIIQEGNFLKNSAINYKV